MHLLATVLAYAPPSAACPGADHDDDVLAAAAEPEECAAHERDEIDPARTAHKPELVGPEACSWTTSMVAQRVLEQGTPWTYVGKLAASAEPLPSRVASPFTVGPDQRIHVVANQILEQVEPRDGARVELTGRVLEVDGITYFVATAVSLAAS
jgi:hypothetical protein